LNDADVTVYNIGNDARFHRGFWDACRQHAGFAIMHDVYLNDSLLCGFREQDDRAGYMRVFASSYGGEAGADAGRHWDGVQPLDERLYSGAPYFLQSSLGAVVHSLAAEVTLRAEMPGLPVAQLPLPYPVRETPRAHDGGAPWKLIVFGYLGGNRCLDRVLEALASGANRDRFRLDIYGEVHDDRAVRSRIQELRLQNAVTIHGFVPEPELDAALAAAHLAINLRYPTKGEASGSQLRIWSHGLPSLVTRTGWYTELPEDTVASVRPESMVEDLCKHFDAYAAASQPYVQSGLAGYRYFASRHSPDAYADSIVEMLAEASAYRKRANALWFADRVGAALQGWFTADHLPGYVDRVAAGIYGIYGPKK
jgi:glycosyltransferase involved in cell wall biosynthesis